MNVFYIISTIIIIFIFLISVGYPSLFVWFSRKQLIEYTNKFEFLNGCHGKSEGVKQYCEKEKSILVRKLAENIQTFSEVEQLFSYKIFLPSKRQLKEFYEIKENIENMYTKII